MSDVVPLHELLYLAAERAQYENKRDSELLQVREAQIEYWREGREHLEERIRYLEADNVLLGQQRDALKEAQQTLKEEAVKEALEEARKAQFHLKELLTNTLKANDKLLTERDTIAEARKAAVKERDDIAKKHAYLLTTLKGLAGEPAPTVEKPDPLPTSGLSLEELSARSAAADIDSDALFDRLTANPSTERPEVSIFEQLIAAAAAPD